MVDRGRGEGGDAKQSKAKEKQVALSHLCGGSRMKAWLVAKGRRRGSRSSKRGQIV
jgi:hypothetical protein